MLFSVGATAVLLASQWALAAPLVNNVGSDLQLLFQNDLNWPTAQDHDSTILLDRAVTHSEAVAACGKLNEGLLSTSGKYFTDDIKNLVKYLEFSRQTIPYQRFWVTGKNDSESSCQTYSLRGGLQSTSCKGHFATFCSQSAPYRSNTDTDRNPAYEVQVQSNQITFLGNRDHLSFRFIGIPYANPVERFSYSTPYTASSPVTLPATSYGSACPQFGFGKEDCLFLNIYTPYIPSNPTDSLAKQRLKPVFVWIHGGGFTAGQSDSTFYDGGNMASRNDLVYVSFNYRLGTLGFLALDDGIVNGNFGIADQVTALKWIKANIAAFGGDPSRVTISGESAGGTSVRALLGSPPALGLFAGAIAQSAPGGYYPASDYMDFPSVADEYNTWDAPFIKSVNCSGSANVLQCLRALPVEIISANPAQRAPIVDGHYITTPRLPVAGQPGPIASAHVIFGWMKDDGALFSGTLPAAGTNLSSTLTSSGVPPDLAEKVVANPDIFPVPTGSNASLNFFNVTSQVSTAGLFSCADQAIVISAGKHKAFPSVYAYSFDRSYSIQGHPSVSPEYCTAPKTAQFPNGDPNQPYFRCHAAELYYTAGNLGQDAVAFRDAGDLLLSQTTVDAWGSFARTYDPNPSFEYLAARGYNESAVAFGKAGPWVPVTAESETPLRILDVELKNIAWRDTKQCELLGLPDTMFDGPMTHSESGYWTVQHGG